MTMDTNTATAVIAMISLVFSIYVYLTKETKGDATEITTIIVKLENINTGINEIKTELAKIKEDQQDDHDRVIKLEQQVQTLFKTVGIKKTGGC
jgi:chromosome segregation ATPase